MTRTERRDFIAERLTSGNMGLEQTRAVTQMALNLAKAKLQEQNVEPPPNWDANHLVSPPAYAAAFAEVVDQVVADGHRARMLPLALELRLFGYSGDERGSSGLIKRVSFSMPITGLIRGFVVQSLGLPEMLTRGPVSHFRELTAMTEPEKTGHSPDLPGIAT